MTHVNSFSYDIAFCRNEGIISKEEQQVLKKSKIALVGMGGVGGGHLISLMRTGIEHFAIADMDQFNLVNFNRQSGATIDSIGKNKAEVMKEEALRINPHASIQVFPEGIKPDNIEKFLEGSDVVIDGIDFFEIEARRLLYREARKRGLYCITAGPLGFSSALIIFSPYGMSFDDYFDINDDMSYKEKIVSFTLGIAPKSLHMKYMSFHNVDMGQKTGPSLYSACCLCSVLASTETINILLKKRRVHAAPHYIQFDPFLQTYKKRYLLWDNRNPIQGFKRWFVLKHVFK